MPKLVLMRGLPGSGKSTLAREIADRDGGVVLSTDDFFAGGHGGGEYQFDPRRLGEAHEWNQERCRVAVRDRRGLIVIDNTNLQVCTSLTSHRCA